MPLSNEKIYLLENFVDFIYNWVDLSEFDEYDISVFRKVTRYLNTNFRFHFGLVNLTNEELSSLLNIVHYLNGILDTKIHIVEIPLDAIYEVSMYTPEDYIPKKAMIFNNSRYMLKDDYIYREGTVVIV